MLTSVPKITGRLREYVLKLAENPGESVRGTFALLATQEEAYGKLSPLVVSDVLSFLDYCAKLLFRSLASGELPTASELAVLVEVARRRVHQGVPLTAILRAFHFGFLAVWKSCIAFADGEREARDELLFSVSSFMLEFFDLMSQTMSQAYLAEQFQGVRWRDSLRYELASIVFRFSDDIDGFQKAAEALGVDPTVPRVALALHVDLPTRLVSRSEEEFDRLTLAISRKTKVAFEDLVRVFHREALIVWIPAIRGENIISADRRIAESAAQLLKACAEIQAIGVGLLNQGPAGWAMTVEEACKALELGVRRGPARAVHVYSDIAVNESVRKTGNALRYLDALLERLADEPDLIAALQSYFNHHQHRRMAADALGIHPNTLNHRLDRIEALLGANLEDAGWIAKLHILLKIRQ